MELPEEVKKMLADVGKMTENAASELQKVQDISKNLKGFEVIERAPVVVGESATYASMRGDNSVVIEFPTPEAQKAFYDSLK